MVILDTNILIDHLRRRQKPTVLDKLEEKNKGEIFCISMITIQELYEGKSTIDENKEKDILTLINNLRVFPYNYEIAKYAGTVARDSKKHIDLADAAIAATAILNEAQLLTLNRKDFVGIKDLELLELTP